jgi:hypothetical protein
VDVEKGTISRAMPQTTEMSRGLVSAPLRLLRARVPFNRGDLAVMEVAIPAGLGDDDLEGEGSSVSELQGPIIRIPVHRSAWVLRCGMLIVAHPFVVGHWKRM